MYFTVALYYSDNRHVEPVKRVIESYCNNNDLYCVSDFPNLFFIRSKSESHRREIYSELESYYKNNIGSIKFLISPLSNSDGFGGIIENNNNWNSIERATKSGSYFADLFDLD